MTRGTLHFQTCKDHGRGTLGQRCRLQHSVVLAHLFSVHKDVYEAERDSVTPRHHLLILDIRGLSRSRAHRVFPLFLQHRTMRWTGSGRDFHNCFFTDTSFNRRTLVMIEWMLVSCCRHRPSLVIYSHQRPTITGSSTNSPIQRSTKDVR